MRYFSFGSGDGYTYYDLVYVSKCTSSEPTATITTHKGDLNHDSTLASADAAIALRIAVSGECVPEADIGENGCVNALDALMIIQTAAGRIEL